MENGKKTTVHTMTSHGSHKQICDKLLGKMARQCHLSRTEFNNLIDCPLSQDRYEEILREKNVVF